MNSLTTSIEGLQDFGILERVLRVYILIKVTSCFAQVIDPLSYGNHANSVLHTVLSTGVCDVAPLNSKPQRRHQLTKVNVVTGICCNLQ